MAGHEQRGREREGERNTPGKHLSNRNEVIRRDTTIDYPDTINLVNDFHFVLRGNEKPFLVLFSHPPMCRRTKQRIE